jgi:hypothetical protein
MLWLWVLTLVAISIRMQIRRRRCLKWPVDTLKNSLSAYEQSHTT